ncbi:MAG: PEP/pyruvate-binding domain-containing protein, partial [Nitrospinales bacterium]
MTQKYVYFFGAGSAEGSGDLKDLLGGKGASLAEMTRLGINVPPGFTISAEACGEYYSNNKTLPSQIWDQILANLKRLEECMDRKFGDTFDPLLLAVRSGARVPMPGLMDTILNLGLNEETACALSVKAQNERFAHDCHRRFIAMFGSAALGMDPSLFETLLDRKKKDRGAVSDMELTDRDLRGLIKKYKALVKKKAGVEFPRDPMEQLRMAVEAAFLSWNAKPAVSYRQTRNIPNE